MSLDLRSAWGLLAGVLSIGLGWMGQRAILQDRGAAAAGEYGLAIVVLLAGLATSKRSTSAGENKPGESAGPQTREESTAAVAPRRTWLGQLFSSGLVAAACILVWIRPGGRQVVPAVLWGLGLLLFVLAFRGRPRRTDAGGFLPGPVDDAPPGGGRLRGNWESILSVSMLLLAAALRFALLEQHPGIFGDEGERGMTARAILEGQPAPFFGWGWAGITNLYYYAVASALSLFGDSLIGLRMLSALSGIAAVFLVYRIGRLLWGPRAGVLAGFFLAVSPLAIQFSRLAGESTPTGTLWAAGFLFLLTASRRNTPRPAALAGISFGLSLYFYPSAKLLFLLLPAVALYLLLRGGRRFARRLVSNLAILFLAFLLTFLPYAVTSFRDGWLAFASRYEERAIFTPPNRPEAFARAGLTYDPTWQDESLPRSFARHPFAWGQVLFTQMRSCFEVLYRNGDATAFYAIRVHRGSMLAPLMAVLTLLGLARAVWRLGDPRFGVLLLWFWGGLLGPALTVDTPSVQRLTGAWPALMLFPAALLDRIAASCEPLPSAFRRWVNVALGVVVAVVAGGAFVEYFGHYRSLDPYGDMTAQARYARSLGQQYRAYQLGVDDMEGGDFFFAYGSTRFLAKGVEGRDVTVLSDVLPVTDEIGKGAAFLVYDSNATSMPVLRSTYPGGREEVVRSAGIARFTSYRLSAAQMAGFHELRATYSWNSGGTLERFEPNLGTRPASGAAWRPPAGLSYPARVVWEGSLVAPAYGRYSFVVSGEPGSRLSVDGVLQTKTREPTASPSRPITALLAKGLHEVRLEGTLRSPTAHIEVTWTVGREPPVSVPRRFLFRRVLGGLTGEVWTNTTGHLPSLPKKAPLVRRVDPAIGFREARDDLSFGKGPFVACWRGSIRADDPGRYRFEARSNGASRLSLDGRPLLSTGASVLKTADVELRPGPHSLELLYQWERDRARLDLSWTPPSGRRQLIGPESWSPKQRDWPLREGTSIRRLSR